MTTTKAKSRRSPPPLSLSQEEWRRKLNAERKLCAELARKAKAKAA